jgi:hypothetical protein
MYEERDLKILLGNSWPLPEEDRDDWSSDYEVEYDAMRNYYFQTVLGGIGTDHFKENYKTFIDIIRQYDIKHQIDLANRILDKIRIRHDFELSVEPDVLNMFEVNNVFALLEFIEYDHESFIIRIWKLLNPKFEGIMIYDYCKRNWNKIIREIEDQIDSYDFNWMISEFLGTNNKNNLIEWFCKKSEKLYTLIKLNLLRKE